MTRRRLTPIEAMAVDGVVAVTTGAFGVWRELRQRGDVDRLVPLPVGWYVAVQVIAAIALLWRRRHPLGVGALIAALCLVTPVQPPAVATYSAAVHAEDRRGAVVVIGVLLLGWAIGAQVWNLDDPITGPVVIAFGGVLGLYVRARRSLYDALVERAERAERDRQWLADRSVADERSRLAAEMHDVLSHRLSLLILEAGALSVASPDPKVRSAAEELRRHGAAALTELKEVFGGLVSGALPPQAPGGASARADVEQPPPDDGSLSELVDGWRRTGGRVSMSVDAPVQDLDLPPSVRRAVYRVVQEGLTNVGKHAPGALVDVAVRCTATDVIVSVRNGAARHAADRLLDDTGTGVGLSGLRQRVELLGGDLSAAAEAERDEPGGAAAQSGFRLSARLPLREVGS